MHTSSPAPLDLLPGAAVARLQARSDEAVLRALAARLRGLGLVEDGFETAVIERERAYPTGLPTPIPVAIPHTDPVHVRTGGLALATLAEPVAFGQMGAGTAGASVPARLVVMILVADEHAHVAALARLVERLQDGEALAAVLAAPDDATLAVRAQAWLRG